MLSTLYYDIFDGILNFLNLGDLKNLNITNRYIHNLIQKYIKYYELQCRVCDIISNQHTICVKCGDVVYKTCDLCKEYIFENYYIKQACYNNYCNCIIFLCLDCVENYLHECNICNTLVSYADICINEMNVYACFECLYFENRNNKTKHIKSYTTYTTWHGVNIGEAIYKYNDTNEPFVILNTSEDFSKYVKNNITEEGYECIILCVKLGYITMEDFYNLSNTKNNKIL